MSSFRKKILSVEIRTLLLIASLLGSGCATTSVEDADQLLLPFIKNSPNECYYLDEFMPTPDNLVTGRTGSLSLRYYTYKQATFKDWAKKNIVLSFYSQDDRCWSLFEEYYIER